MKSTVNAAGTRADRAKRKRVGVAAALCIAVWATWAGAAPPTLRLKSRSERVELPPLAREVERDGSENAWTVTGRLSGGFETVFNDFQLSMGRQGWSWRTVTLRQSGARTMALISLNKDRARLLLMIWESGPGQCGFSVGEDRSEDDG